MLVLNTNEWWNWIKTSNKILDLWTYPDFNQILIIPESVSWTDTNVAFSVNWTNVNRLSLSINSLTYDMWALWTNANVWGSNEIWRVQIGNTSSWSSHTTTSVWMFWQFSWWEIVWKNIYSILKMRYWRVANNSWTHSCTVSWTINIQMLHSDWTKTLIWTITIPGTTKSWSFGASQTTIEKIWEYKVSTSWIVASQWDTIVADFSVDVSVNWTYSWWWLTFWTLWSISPMYMPTPIQISIE